MRALIVLGGDAPEPELLRACSKNADLTIAADSGLAAFDAAGLAPDLLIGDMDSIDPALLGRYAALPQERLCCVKDDTDGVHAVDVALARGAERITLLGALGGRMDHALANLMLLVRAHRGGAFAEILGGGVHVIRVPGEAVLRGAKGDTVSFLPLGDARGVTLTGFFYPLDRHDLHSDYPLGVSNVVTQDEASVSVQDGDLLMFHVHS